MKKNNRIKMILLSFSLFIPFCGCGQSNNIPSINVAELDSLMQTDSTLVILDVRMPSELIGPLGQIPHVINIPVQELESRIDELEKHKANFIAVICRSGNRSRTATKILIQNGYTAKNVLGGMIDYNNRTK